MRLCWDSETSRSKNHKCLNLQTCASAAGSHTSVKQGKVILLFEETDRQRNEHVTGTLR